MPRRLAAALGYEQRFGRRADLIEIHNLDHGGSVRELVDDAMTQQTIAAVTDAGQRLRDNRLDRVSGWCEECGRCDLVGICRSRQA
ncbi:MAG: hypothetical protein HY699_19610 [Deltaproteobacteria bacterium]|nr:hypothetical protein [Deltaproteobacteria bacterium]